MLALRQEIVRTVVHYSLRKHGYRVLEAPDGAAGIELFRATAGEVNLVMQPGPSGSAAVTVLLDGKPVGDAHGADVGSDGVARFDRSGGPLRRSSSSLSRSSSSSRHVGLITKFLGYSLLVRCQLRRCVCRGIAKLPQNVSCFTAQ